MHKFTKRFQSVETPSFHQILVYGYPRAGKTSFIGSGAFDDRIAPILVLDFDQGATSLVGLPDDKITVVSCSTWDDLSEAYDYLANDDHPFQSVALDSLTQLHTYALTESARISYEAARKNKGRAERLTDVDTQQNDFKRALDQMRRFVYTFKALPMNLIVTAHAKATLHATSTMGDGGGYVRLPNLYGQFAEEAVGLFNTTVYLSSERRNGNDRKSEPQRVLVLQNMPEFMTGVRAPWGAKVPNRIRITQSNGMRKLIDVLDGVYGQDE